MEHLYVYDARGFSIGTPIYLNVVHIIFFFPIVTPPLTWLFLLERLYTVSEDYIHKVYYGILLQLFEGGGFPATRILGQSLKISQ